ncbi:MAG: hypothetical protein AB7L28_24475, partial [Kofleriaceae bacterium]
MMRALVIAGLVCWAGSARADQSASSEPPAVPVRVAIECQEVGRTKACPAFLRGFVDQHHVLLGSPRAGADVVVYATATTVGTIDRMHLRFVGQSRGMPAPVELDVELDTRASDDAQRATLAPVFRRGVALFVAARHPSAVDVVLSAPKSLARRTRGSPWGFEIGVSGNGSYTEQYQTAGANVHLIGRYLQRNFRAFTLQLLEGGLNRQPALVLDDGTTVSLDSQKWTYRFGAEAIYLLNDTWSIGAGSYTFLEDPKAQYKYN